jgi:TonB family protein
VKKSAFGCLLFFIAAACFGQIQGGLCPKHIETPQYPPLARQTHITGKITLTVTVDADGRVKHVEAVTDNQVQRAQPLLQDSAVENMQHWTFAKPSFAPYTQVIVYDYEFDATLPPSRGPSSLPSITKVTIDLPDHVKILINEEIIEPAKPKIHR